jgi:hypothetical protein
LGRRLTGLTNLLTRAVVKENGVAFKWQRLSFSVSLNWLPQLQRRSGHRGWFRSAESGHSRIRPPSEGRRPAATNLSVGRAISGVIAELRSARLQSNAVERVGPDLRPIHQCVRARTRRARLQRLAHRDCRGISARRSGEIAMRERAGVRPLPQNCCSFGCGRSSTCCENGIRERRQKEDFRLWTRADTDSSYMPFAPPDRCARHGGYSTGSLSRT